MGGKRGLERGPSAPERTRARCGSPAQEERRGRKKGFLNPPDEALGRSKGGFSTKLHLFCCDGGRRPLSVVLTGGQRHESTQLGAVLDAIRVPRASRGRPRKRPSHLNSRQGLQLPQLPQLPHLPEPFKEAGRSSHHSRAARPTRAAREASGTQAGLREGNLSQAQRGGAVREQAQAVAGDSHAPR